VFLSAQAADLFVLSEEIPWIPGLQARRTLNYSGFFLLSVYCGFAGANQIDEERLRSEKQVEARINCQPLGSDGNGIEDGDGDGDKMRWGPRAQLPLTKDVKVGESGGEVQEFPAGILILFCLPNCC